MPPECEESVTKVFWPGRGYTQPLSEIQAGVGSEDLIIDGEGEREAEESLTITPNLTPKAAVNIFTVVKANFSSFLWARAAVLRMGAW